MDSFFWQVRPGNEVHPFFMQMALLILIAGFLHSFLSFYRRYRPGFRIGTIVGGSLSFTRWVCASGVVYWLAPSYYIATWYQPELMLLTVVMLFSVITLYLSNWLLLKVFLPKTGATANFHGLIPRFSQEQKRMIAVHEAGHLLAHASVSPDALPRMEVRVGCRYGGHAGYVMSFTSALRSSFPSASFLHWEALMVLAGDQACAVVLKQRFTGSESDMKRWWGLGHRILMGGLGVAPWPQGDFVEVNVMRLDALSRQLNVHRQQVTAFLQENRNLLLRTANHLERTGYLDDLQCRVLLKQVVAIHLLPSVGKEHVVHHRRKMKIDWN